MTHKIQTSNAMDESEKPTDLRSVKSREALCKALLALLEDRPLSQITAKEVARNARVGYATFFRHYDTVEALLNDIAAEQVNEVMRIAMPGIDAADSLGSCKALCEHVNQHRKLWKILLTGGAEGAVRAEFLRFSREFIAHVPEPSATWLPMPLGIVLTVTCTVELLSWWLTQDEPESVNRIAEIMDGVLHRRLLNDNIK